MSVAVRLPAPAYYLALAGGRALRHQPDLSPVPQEGLAVRKRRARRTAVGTRCPILVEAKVNARWSLDFVHDQFTHGRRFSILNVVDDVTRECLAAFLDLAHDARRTRYCLEQITRFQRHRRL